MNPIVIGLLAFASVFGASLLGMRLRAAMPDQHLSAESKDSVRLGMAMVVTMTALLLGLLVASAKGSYDTQRGQVILISARLAFLDRVLSIYGPETAETRKLLTRTGESFLLRLWPDEKSQQAPQPFAGQAMYESIQSLTPQNDMQRTLKAQALETSAELSKILWLLSAQDEPSIITPLLAMVIAWLALIFLSFGVFAPTNKTVITTLLLVALTVSSALFVITELDRPFNGVLRISSAPLRKVVSRLGQ